MRCDAPASFAIATGARWRSPLLRCCIGGEFNKEDTNGIGKNKNVLLLCSVALLPRLRPQDFEAAPEQTASAALATAVRREPARHRPRIGRPRARACHIVRRSEQRYERRADGDAPAARLFSRSRREHRRRTATLAAAPWSRRRGAGSAATRPAVRACGARTS